MNVDDLFYKNLYEKEIFSFMYENQDYILEDIDFVSKPLSIDTSLIENQGSFFSDELKKNLEYFYSQASILSVNWDVSGEVSNELLDETDWLKKYRESEGLSYSFIREQLSGTINIVSLEDMFDQKKFSYLKRDGVQYLPFDEHYSLTACFKLENGEVEDNIYILNNEDSDIIEDMQVDCVRYLELAYQSKLFYYWQYAYLDKTSIHNERLNTMLPVIFPFVELNLSDFQ